MTTEPTDKQKEETQELLPCPFCGSNSTVWSENFGRVRCNGCFIGTVTVQSDLRIKDDALKQRCIHAWNTRVLSARDAEIREVLEGLSWELNLGTTTERHWCPSPMRNGRCTNECIATRVLWEKLQPAKEKKRCFNHTLDA